MNLFIFFLILFNSSILTASVYDDDTLEIFSKILPRIVLMSSQKEKITNDLNICVVHDNLDERIAQSLIDKVSNNYKNGIKNLKINLINTNYSTLNNCKNTQLLFMFNSNEENIKKTILFSNKNKLITMSYDSKLLEDGVGISLFLGRKIVPYINTQAIHKNDVEFNNILLRISKIYSKKRK